jgi:hypothetical protein
MPDHSDLTVEEIDQRIEQLEHERADLLDRAVEQYIDGLELEDLVDLVRDYIRDEWEDLTSDEQDRLILSTGVLNHVGDQD